MPRYIKPHEKRLEEAVRQYMEVYGKADEDGGAGGHLVPSVEGLAVYIEEGSNRIMKWLDLPKYKDAAQAVVEMLDMAVRALEDGGTTELYAAGFTRQRITRILNQQKNILEALKRNARAAATDEDGKEQVVDINDYQASMRSGS